VQNDFLQENMIDVGEGAYPVLFDYDSDGDKDLLIGNNGYFSSTGQDTSKIALYRNDGTTTNPSFTLVNDDFAGIYTGNNGLYNLAPTFGDLDGDGDKDMLIGDFNGQLHYFRKNAGNAENFTLFAGNYQGIDVGDFATPQLVDVNRDNKIDLLIGEQDGRVRYYENTGTTSAPIFTLITSTFGGVDVRQPGWYSGYSVPLMFDDNGAYTLVVGSERGWLYRYDNIEGNLSGSFTLTDSMFVSWREGGFSAPAVGDINNDGLYDMIIGNYAGGVSLFMGDNSVSTSNLSLTNEPEISISPNPALTSFTIHFALQLNQHATYSIIDLNGRIVVQGLIQNQYTIVSCATLPDGIYFCRVEDKEGRVINKKILITHP
jgi:hypothetical protein